LKSLTVMSTIKIHGASFENDHGAIALSVLWGYVAIAAMNAIAYATFALCGECGASRPRARRRRRMSGARKFE